MIMGIIQPKRICTTCKIRKYISKFSPDFRNKGKYHKQAQCKKCKSKWMREDRIKHNEKYRLQDLRNNYNLSIKMYQKLCDKQEGVCAICKQREQSKRGWLQVDHCHRTGKVRGLFCGNCNTGLGKFGDNADTLQSAAKYARRCR